MGNGPMFGGRSTTLSRPKQPCAFENRASRGCSWIDVNQLLERERDANDGSREMSENVDPDSLVSKRMTEDGASNSGQIM